MAARRQGKHWTTAEVRELRKLAAGNTPTRVIGIKLQRSEDSVRSQATKRHVSLRPWNQRPYNRRSGR